MPHCLVGEGRDGGDDVARDEGEQRSDNQDWHGQRGDKDKGPARMGSRWLERSTRMDRWPRVESRWPKVDKVPRAKRRPRAERWFRLRVGSRAETWPRPKIGVEATRQA